MTGDRDAHSLADLVARKRAREGLSLRQAGATSGIAFSTLGRIERGRVPSLRVERQLRAWLEGATPPLPPPPMTLRDWFAGMVLAGMSGRDTFDQGQVTPEQRAKLAYIDADAMLAERKAEPTP